LLYSREAQVSVVHSILAKVPFCAAVTPNLDPLLELAMRWDRLGPGDLLETLDHIAQCLPFVLKLRGSPGDKSLAVWPDEAMADLRKSSAEPVRELFYSRTMLALGVSPGDLYKWLNAAGVSRSESTHFLITADTDPEHKLKAEALCRKFHVRSLLTGGLDGPDVLSFLRRLASRKA
jgi:hypothetical protein